MFLDDYAQKSTPEDLLNLEGTLVSPKLKDTSPFWRPEQSSENELVSSAAELRRAEKQAATAKAENCRTRRPFRGRLCIDEAMAFPLELDSADRGAVSRWPRGGRCIEGSHLSSESRAEDCRPRRPFRGRLCIDEAMALPLELDSAGRLCIDEAMALPLELDSAGRLCIDEAMALPLRIECS
jgi:hypothetical protein